jgi:cell division protein FtsI/penicillin-binding protein 2
VKEDHTLRFYFLGIVMSMLPIMILFRLVFIQLNPDYKKYFEEVLLQGLNEPKKITATRGSIYDRNGSLLAGNQRTYEVGVALDQMRDEEVISNTLGLILDRSSEDIMLRIEEAKKDGFIYVVIDDFVSQEKVDKINEWIVKFKASPDPKIQASLNGLHLQKHLKRTYPNNQHAANIIGYVGWKKEVSDPIGIYGVEGYYQEFLSGISEIRSINRKPTEAEDRDLTPEGASLVLSISLEIQAMAEEVLQDELRSNGADSGTILIMNPQNGEILAIATTPEFDPNRYWEDLKEFNEEIPFNRAISQPFEPGSTFKVLTVAAALDSGAVDENFMYDDKGVLEYAGIYIYNWNRGAWGKQGLLGCLQHSLNVCMATLATQYLGPETFYQYMRAFGIGQATGIDMDGEVSGVLKTPHKGSWYHGDLATNSFGQSLTTTPIQLARAVSAIANHGQMKVPHVVMSIAQNGYQRDVEIRTAGNPIRGETADYLNELLAQSLEQEASDALVPGYRNAGKTGTAQIPDLKLGGYHPYLTNASFIGWGPVDDPQYLVYVWFEKPATSPWGSEVAAPVFARVVEKLVVLLDLPPDDVRLQFAKR